jgi:hypothetical protein
MVFLGNVNDNGHRTILQHFCLHCMCPILLSVKYSLFVKLQLTTSTKINTVEIVQSDTQVFRHSVTPDKNLWSPSISIN